MEHLRHATGNVSARIMIVTAFCFALVLMDATFAEATKTDAAAKPMVTQSPGADAQATSRADTLAPVPEPLPEPQIMRVYDTAPTDTLGSIPEPEPGSQSVRAYKAIPTATRIRMGAHTFTTDRMSNAYDRAYVGSVEALMLKKGFGMGFEIGWTSTGKGTPPLVDSDWVLTDSWVKMSAVLLEANVYYNFLDDTGSELFGPYAAAGPAMWVGGERLAAEATRASGVIVEGFEAEQLALGLSFGVSGMIGTTVRIKGRFKALVEARYVLSTSGSTLDLVKEEDEDLLNATLYSVVERPGFNFTGWQITIGVQW